MPLVPRRLRAGGARAPGLAALYLVAATSPRVAAFLLLPVYAFKLSPSELAAYGIAIAMAQLIGIICDFGVLEGMGIMYFELPEEERHSFLKTTMVLSRLMSLVLMIPIGIILAAFWDPLFGDGLPLNPGLWLILGFTFLQRGNTLAGGVYRVRNLHGHFATTKIVPAMVQTVAGLLFVFVLDWGAVGAIAAAPTGFLVSIVVAGVASRRAFEPSPFVRITRQQAARIIARGVPTLPEQLSSWGQLLSLRPLLALFATVQETASFVFSNAPAQIVAPFNEAYAQYVTPKYYQSCADDDTDTVRSLRDMTSLSIGFGAIATIGAIVVFDPIFERFAPLPYQQGAGLAAIGLAGILLRGPMGLLVHNVRIEDRRVALVVAVVVATGVSYAQFFLLAPTFGAFSAAWSIYLYAATGCVIMMSILNQPRFRLVDIRDFVVTQVSVLVVLLVMLVLTHGGEDSLGRWLALLGVGLVGVGVVAWFALRRHLETARSLLSVGVTATARGRGRDGADPPTSP